MRKNVPVSKKVARILITIVIILVTLVMIVPFVWMISASFKTEADVMKIPIEWIPKYFYPDNYKRVLSIGTTSSTNYHFGLAYFNSIKVAVISTVVAITSATLAGYAFKAFQLADADIIMLYIIAVLVISIFTSKMYFCLISSLVGVMLFNCFFTYPEFSLSVHDAGYLVTFVTMFITAFIAGTLANKLKRNILIAEQNAREKEEAALLAQNEQLRADMLRSISHDLRTPLTSISGNASTLISGGDTLDESARQQIYTDIYSESMWLIEMVENLLYATRIEDGRMQLNISVEILDDIVQEAVRHTKRTHPKRNIIVDMYDEIIPVMADANLIVQVIVNLMDNAVKYSDEDSDVTVSVRRENAHTVEISVSDHGTGISDEEKEKVFDMFYTGGSRSSDSRRSLGLGLALCRSIITSHGGTISVSDKIPNGTVVSFTLPIGEVDLNE